MAAPTTEMPTPEAPAADAVAPTTGASSSDPKVAARLKKLAEYQGDIAALEAKRDQLHASGEVLSNSERAKLSKRKAAAEALENGEAEPRIVHPGPESDSELAAMLGRFFGTIVFPVMGVFARRWFEGTIGRLTAAEQVELGTAFVPWARKMPWLTFVARWATAPATFIAMVEAKFQPFRTEQQISPPAPPTDRTAPQQPLRAVPDRPT